MISGAFHLFPHVAVFSQVEIYFDLSVSGWRDLCIDERRMGTDWTAMSWSGHHDPGPMPSAFLPLAILCSKGKISVKKHDCVQCGRMDEGRIFIIDGKRMCAHCIFGDVKPIEMYPIGTIKNNLQRNRSDFGLSGDDKISRIELVPSQEPFMFKLVEEKYLTIVYYLHQSRSVRSRFKRGLDGKEVGVFASRTPDRLSKIGIQDVKLIKIEGITLYVEGLDAINESPVLDIKLKWNKTLD